jgi:tRNA(Leu) C34 or U34 (ribose-2'-O)-methylase TrmL
VAAALRACSSFDMNQLWWSGNRVEFDGGKKGQKRLPREERMKGYGDVELCHGEYFFDAFPADVTPVAVELKDNAESLRDFEHPEKALYVFGPEDGTLGRTTLHQCHRFVVIPSKHCLNLATAVSVVLYDRSAKLETNLRPVDEDTMAAVALAGVEGPVG